MGNFIKENLVLVMGITLPVLLVVGFLVLANVPPKMLTPTKYDFIVIGYRYNHQHLRNYYLNFEVKDKKLRARVTPKDDSASYHTRQHATLFRYNAADKTFDEIAYELPDGLEDLEKQTTFPVEEVKDLRLNKKSKSPDGFTFEHLGYRGSGGLLGQIFGMRRSYQSEYVLVKNGIKIELPHPANKEPYYYYGNNLVFLGWVMSEGSAE